MGASIGTFAVWSCMKYIPHRLAGVTPLVPVVNYWWPSLPPKLAQEGLRKQLKRDQRKLWIAHRVPWLMYWWMPQRMFPYSSFMQRHPLLLNPRDLATIQAMSKFPNPHEHKTRHQGDHESIHRDLILHSGKWEFDPMELDDPLRNGEGSVHLWQGKADWVVSWIRYHEVTDGGHFMIHEKYLCEAMFREPSCLGEPPPIG